MTWVSAFRALEDDCRRAPSAHNTQPWVLRHTDDAVDVHWDPSRALPDSDPTRRDLFLSLGAFIETCLIVAASAGLPVHAEIAVDHATLRAARLLPGPAVYGTPFTVESVRQRRCARGGYTPGVLDPETLSALASLGADLRQVPARSSSPRSPRPTGGCSARRRSSTSCARGCGCRRSIRGITSTASPTAPWPSPGSRPPAWAR